MASIGIVYLVWGPLGLKPLKAFLESYRDKPAGIEHDLLIVYNGFSHQKELADYEEVLKDYSCRILFIEGFGVDIGSYHTAANTFDYDYFCFLN